MNKQAVIILLLLIVGGVTSCNLPAPSIPRDEIEEISQYSTVSSLLTETAGVTDIPLILDITDPELTPAPPVEDATRPAATLVVTAAALATVVDGSVSETQTPLAPASQPPAAPCEQAQPGRPIDITVPDDTKFTPGEYFSKTWQLVNAGTCAWTGNYAVVWFSGDNLGLTQAQPIAAQTGPGGTVEVTVEMQAPQRPGVYQSNWKLRNPQGELFGIGPNGEAPFWVRIVVVPFDTPTATPTFPGATPTPMVFASGSLFLQLDQGTDLDSGQIEITEHHDLLLIRPQEENFWLAPANGARLAAVGIGAPGMLDCTLAPLSENSVDLGQVPEGSYLCYRTTQGLPGRMYLSAVNAEQSTVTVEFVTWVVP